MIITRPSSSYLNLITDDLERGGEGGERDIIGTAPIATYHHYIPAAVY